MVSSRVADRLHGESKVAADKLRGGKGIFVVRREMSRGSGLEGDCRNGGAVAAATAENEGCWEEEIGGTLVHFFRTLERFHSLSVHVAPLSFGGGTC